MGCFLITGGAGFIGSNYCHYVVDKYKNDYFICLDALTYAGNIDNISELFNRENFKFIHGNICDKELLDRIFNEYKIDYVINFAAESHVDNSLENPYIFYETNVLGTLVLLDLSVKYSIKKFHQISTDEVYGSLGFDDCKFKEEDILNPSSPYSASKAAADLLVLSYHKSYNLNVSISRCSNNYGPYQNKEKLIPKVIVNALNNEVIPVYGNGLNVRDWIYVLDHCRAVDLIVRCNKEKIIYNVGANCEISNLELVKEILKKLNKDEELIHFVDDRLGHDLRYSIDYSLLKLDYSFEPEILFNEGLDNTINWYKSNK